MKRWRYFFLFVFFSLVSCKTDRINGNSIKEFQESVNEMSSNIKTIRQVKFREALHIIKQFGVKEEEDLERMNAIAKILHGKKITEVFSLADSIASRYKIDWSSDAPPSLNDIDIFLNNDIHTTSVDIDSTEAVIEENLTPLNEIPVTLIYPGLDKPSDFVSMFLQNISEKKLLDAYRMSDNLDWQSFDVFSNPISGFGAVEHIDIENIVLESKIVDETNVNAAYIVTNNVDTKIALNVSFVLRPYAKNWKIIHYKVNSAQKL